MLGFFRRLMNLLTGKTSAVLESPVQRLSVSLSDLNKQQRVLERSVTSAIADEKRLQQQIAALRVKAGEWESRALAALERGKENRAKIALEKQERCDAEAAALESSWKAQNEAAAQLKDSLKLTQSRMEEARRNYNLLLAQYKWARTKKKIRRRALRVAAPALMAQLEDRIRSVEAEAEAQLVLNAESVDLAVEASFHRIDAQREGDAALERLKAKLAERGPVAFGGAEATKKGDAPLKRFKVKLAERRQAASGGAGATERVASLKRTLDS
jgi:phage shock protein A